MTYAPHDHRTVLVVEDECVVRLDAVQSLREAGYQVLEAGDAAEALEIVANRCDIGVIFTDINMPGAMDGIELARRVHQSHPAIELILTSGEVKPEPCEIPDNGAFLAKPYSAGAVTSAVGRKMRYG